ncbi:MAG: hypothetical protein ACLUW6_00415 [Coriobacteriaceae bacterium]
MALPVLWNTGGYETVEAVRDNIGFVDPTSPIFKYADGELAARYPVPPTIEVALAALKAMVDDGCPALRWVPWPGAPRLRRGLRHLMPRGPGELQGRGEASPRTFGAIFACRS